MSITWTDASTGRKGGMPLLGGQQAPRPSRTAVTERAGCPMHLPRLRTLVEGDSYVDDPRDDL